MLIHAINPHGFAWLRRVTEDNVDLNRNWIDFDQPAPANPAYDALGGGHLSGILDEAAQAASAPGARELRRDHGSRPCSRR